MATAQDIPEPRPTCLHLLLIEDNIDDVIYIEEILQTTIPGNYVILQARSLEQAKLLMSVYSFDAVLLDLKLDDSDRQATIPIIRHLSASVPVIVLSGLIDQDTTRQALSNGAMACICKDNLAGPFLHNTINTARQLFLAI